MFAGRCYLCGDPTRGLYCHAHSWAEGTETTPVWAQNEQQLSECCKKTAEKVSANVALLDRDMRYWMDRFQPAEVLELAAGISS